MGRVDLEAAIGFVVAHGDEVDRARLAYLRTGAAPAEELLARVEAGQVEGAGWPAQQGDRTCASVDATCFRFAELDDLGALGRPAARQALDWLACALRRLGVDRDDPLVQDAQQRLAETQRPDGGWPSDDGDAFTMHTTLTAIRACRPA